MDFVEASYGFQDWELLQPYSDSETAPIDGELSSHEIVSGAFLKANYFLLDAREEVLDDDKSPPMLDSASWINPALVESPNHHLILNRESGVPWSDHSSGLPESPKCEDLEHVNEMGFSGNGPDEVTSQGMGEILEENLEKVGVHLDSSGFEDDSPGYSRVSLADNMDSHSEMEVVGEKKDEHDEIASDGQVVDDPGNKIIGELEKKSIVWWKMPLEFLKCRVFKMSPLLTVSVAAAVMGFVILSHRLYRMKKKARGLEIKVAVEDKKISQAMRHAARLNEAFSVVKRVSVIRTSLPAGSVTSPWPVMSSR